MADRDTPAGAVAQPREGDVFLPWPISAVRHNARGDMVVEIEADLLSVLTARALAQTETLLTEHTAKPHPGPGQRGYDYQSLRSRLQRDIFNYTALAQWCQRLTNRRPSW